MIEQNFKKSICYWSIKDNAKKHINKNIVVNVDISNFFPNSKKDIVWSTLYKYLKNSYDISSIRFIHELSCYRESLPQGAPTSPTISNLIMNDFDKKLNKVCEMKNISYTRYADDLTFSGDASSISILPFVKDLLSSKGYMLDPKKTNIFRKGRRQVVTGLVVNEQVSVARPIRKKIRAAVHNIGIGKAIHWHDK